WRAAEAFEARAAPDARPRRKRGRGKRDRDDVTEAWQHVREVMTDSDRYRAAWDRAKSALGRFRPDGRLNDWSWAESEIRAACEQMPHARWSRLRSLLQDERTLAFLDRMHRQLAAAAPRPNCARLSPNCGVRNAPVGAAPRSW